MMYRRRHDVCKRLKGSAVMLQVSAPLVMSNVCQAFGPQGALCKLQAHMISIAAEHYKAMSEFGVTLDLHSST